MRQALLVGTFHFNNPGHDVAKTKSFDILGESAQTELGIIIDAISGFNPDKIFVEWPFDEQNELDSLYGAFRGGEYFHEGQSDFYRKNEIFQLAFRLGANLNHDRIFAIDYVDSEFPYDSMMTVVERNNQTDLQAEFDGILRQATEEFDNLIVEEAGLTELLLYNNTDELRRLVNEFHTVLPLKVGGPGNTIGPYLTAEWYRRNLYMWSYMQKQIHEQDSRVMVLLGASHIAMFEQFAAVDSTLQVRELKEFVTP